MNYKQASEFLIASTDGVFAKIAKNENEKAYNEHLDPFDPSIAIKVDKNYVFLPKTFSQKFKVFVSGFFLRKLYKYTNQRFHTEIVGAEKIKDIDSAIVTCNHVNKLDSVAISLALKGKKVNIVAAPFNNMSGFVGDMMRASGMLPLGSDFGGMKNFNLAIETCLQKGCVLFFPEQSEWWLYEKPRPFKIGAYHYAVKHDKPVIPMLITFKPSDEKDINGVSLKKFVVNVLEPIYPDKSLPEKERAEDLLNKNYALCKAKYEEFYNKELVL